MSRETFIQSEDKELEVTFREVRNWDEYSDLDFESDTAPLTEQEAGTDSEDELLEESTVTDSDESDNESDEFPVVEDVYVDEDVDIEDESGEVEPEEDSFPEDVATDVDAEEDAEEETSEEESPVESGEEESDEETSDVTDEGYASDTSQEAVVTLPVIADNFEEEPAWEEPVAGDEDEETVLVDEESADEELPIGEKGEDTESLGESLENIYSLSEAEEERKPQTLQDIVEEAIESGEPILVGTVRDADDYTIGEVNFEKNDDSASEESEVVGLDEDEEEALDPYAFTPDTSDIDTFEAISSEDESLNKAETVEEIPAEYSEDTLPDTVAIDTIDSGDYFSFDDVVLDSDEDKEEEKEETPAPVSEESTDDDSDEELSLELDYSEDDDK